MIEKIAILKILSLQQSVNEVLKVIKSDETLKIILLRQNDHFD